MRIYHDSTDIKSYNFDPEIPITIQEQEKLLQLLTLIFFMGIFFNVDKKNELQMSYLSRVYQFYKTDLNTKI